MNIFMKKGKEKKRQPHIVFANREIEKKLAGSYISGKPINECLELLLPKIGINPTTQILIDNYKRLNGKETTENGFSIDCYENTEFRFKLCFICEYSFLNATNLICMNGSRQYPQRRYKISYDTKQREIKMEEISYETKYKDGVKYCRNFSPEAATYKVTEGENELVLTIERPEGDSKFYQNGIFNRYEPRKEFELIDYITTLIFPISIDEVYKKICEISLGADTSSYPFIYLHATNAGKVTDLIELEKGQCKRFIMTKNGKSVCINQNGSWTYEFDTGKTLEDISDDRLAEDTTKEDLTTKPSVKFKMSCTNDQISYNVLAQSASELDTYTKELATYDILTAKKEIEHVKKLVRELVPKK